MNQPGARARVLRARVEVDHAEQRIAVRWRQWRERVSRHRLSLLIGGGLLSGLAVAVVSPKYWSSAGAALFNAGARLTRSPIGPALLGSILIRFLGRSTTMAKPAVKDAATRTEDA